jgi:putrescine aminotransferase
MQTEADSLAIVRRHMSASLAAGYKLTGSGAEEVGAEGAIVRLSDGREVVDFGSYGIGLLGHRHPDVVAAVARQLETMPSATRALPNAAVASFVTELIERCGGPPLERVWLGSDGADAVEVAVKLARRRTGRPRVLAVEQGFHGKTLGALALTWNPAFRTGLESQLADVTHVSRDDRDAVAREVAAGDVAALVFEPVQGEGGVRPIDGALLARWASDLRAAGAYLISDEIQAGLGRCGPFSPSVAAGLEPDAVLLGKALGGGLMPLSAVVATADLHKPLARNPTWHSSTFGGHPLACAAGSAALPALDGLSGRAAELARAIERALRTLAAEHPRVVTDVRGVGLMWGLELAGPGLASTVLTDLGRRGLLVSPCLSSVTTIRLLPPMVTTDDQLARAVELLALALEGAEEMAAEASPATPG